MLRSKKAGLIFLLSFLLVSNAFARHDMAIQLESDGVVLPLEKILKIANGYHEGRVIDAELVPDNSKYIYEVDLLDKGGVLWELKFDASTGKLLTEKKGE